LGRDDVDDVDDTSASREARSMLERTPRRLRSVVRDDHVEGSKR
jgi:hypothetical protein